MRKSKANLPKSWVTWYRSGAVAQPKLGGKKVKIKIVGIFPNGPLEDFVELNLKGKRSFLDILVPKHPKFLNDNYPRRLPAVPKNGIPSHLIKYPLGIVTPKEKSYLKTAGYHES